MKSLAIIILANNEECVIADSVGAVVQALSPDDKLFVIADNCTDDTVNIAVEAGAQVVVRNNGGANGKGHALAWFGTKYAKEICRYQKIVILDADSVIQADFLEVIKSNINQDMTAYQCFVSPLYENHSPIGQLAALSELIDQHGSEKIRAMLNWPVRFRGTGMVLSPEILVEVSPQLDTFVEDIALTLLLTARRIPIQRIEAAIVCDPKPETSLAATQQRARWFRGQWHAFWRYRKELGSIIRKGPAGWALLSAIFLRPKWLSLLISLALTWAFSEQLWAVMIFGGYFVSEVVLLLIGTISLPDKKQLLSGPIFIPAYIYMWIRSIMLSLQPSTWRRTRN